MPRTFNYIRAASALVEAALKPDQEVALAFGVSVRAIETWRSRLQSDQELQRVYREMAEQKLAQWVSAIPESLELAIGFIGVAARSGDTTNPDMVTAITKAIATLNDVLVIQAAIQQRLDAAE